MRYRRQVSLIFTIASLVIGAVVLVVAYFISSDFDFRRFRSLESNISIRYPAGWVVKENYGGATAVFISPLENNMDLSPETVSVIVDDLSGHPRSLKEYSQIAEHQVEVVFEKMIEVQESSDTKLAGLPAHKFVYLVRAPQMNLKFMHVWTLHNDRSYQVNYSAIDSQFDQTLPKVKKMINSFKIK